MLDHAAPVYYKQQLDYPGCSTSPNLYLSTPVLSYLVSNLPEIQRARHTSVKASTAAEKLPCWYRFRPCCSNTAPSPRGAPPVRRSPTLLPAELRNLDPSGSDREPIMPVNSSLTSDRGSIVWFIRQRFCIGRAARVAAAGGRTAARVYLLPLSVCEKYIIPDDTATTTSTRHGSVQSTNHTGGN